MVIAVDHTDAPSRRVVVTIAGSIGALFVLLVAGSVALQGSGAINGYNEIATVGSPISIRVENERDIRVDMTVTELSLVTDAQRARSDMSQVDVYLVRYEVSGIDEIVPATSGGLWRLVDDQGTVHVGSDQVLPAAAHCGSLHGADGEGCVVISVPAGTVVTMVRYYGVKTFWYPGKPTASEVWAGWAA